MYKSHVPLEQKGRHPALLSVARRLRFGLHLMSAIEKPVVAYGPFLARLRERLPTFLGIGMQKSGTSWLHECLACHPDISLPVRKELHYFNRSFHMPLAYYAQNFEADAACRGEFTPLYAGLSHRRISYIRRLLPDARLIMLLRDPVDRIWSLTKMSLATRWSRRMADIPTSQIQELWSKQPFCVNYAQILDKWLEHFPREQLFIGFYDDIVDCPETLVSRVVDFLGVSVPDDWDSYPLRKVVFHGPRDSVPAELRQQAEEWCQDGVEELATRYEPRASKWFANWHTVPSA